MILGRVFGAIREVLRKNDGGKRRAFQRSDAGASLISLLSAPSTNPRNLNYETMAWVLAGVQAAEYMVRNMMGAENLVERTELLEYALDRCTVSGLVLEFGVYTGRSLRTIANRSPQTVHGFDSFEGLPEDWTYFQKQGRFGLGGRVPAFEETNIEIHAGWFDATLPAFLESHPGPVRFVHIDCDVYSSTATVLKCLAQRLVPGTIIVFDEYLNYPGWQQHEFRAFQEFIEQASFSYRYLGFASADCSVAIELITTA